MPNHVHVVVQPYGEHKLSQIILSWKTWSARHANELLKRDGRFWQREYYDRIVRCPLSHEGTVRYVLNNPAKAGLHGWQFMGSSEVDYSSIAWLGTQT
jgi:REP element-mobilizing transposase RayT